MTALPTCDKIVNELHVEGLTRRYGERTVVRDVSLRVRQGEVVGLLGPNGAGKTTAFKIILGLTPPHSGNVTLGRSLNGLPLYKRARHGLGYLPQGPSVFAGLTVQQNLLGVLQALKLPNAAQRADTLLQQFHLTHLASQKAATLSGGERRKLEFARSICARPTILLMDEPFAAVDPIAQQELCQMIRRMAEDGIGVLLTDHSVRQSLSVCDHVYLIVDGAIVEQGTSDAIRQSHNARALYLGNDI
ncbi:MAG: LPS export ABC transporter ATP-binding protein [Deltaproteobacteria bacterium]|nr:LPS export ABC transporter ATP-binding protein [Deltaproteobacteria bacterium]